MRDRLRALCIVTLGGFAITIVRAAIAYSGGSYWDADQRGFTFWHNYWCDLLAHHAHDGAENRVSQRFARVAFACFGVALASFFAREARRAPASAALRLRIAAGTSVALLAGVRSARRAAHPSYTARS